MTGGNGRAPGEGVIVAIDIGASSGRVMVAEANAETLDLEEVHRFPNEPLVLPTGLHWDADRLLAEVLDGLRRVAARGSQVASIGIDTWGCDVGWLDAGGTLLVPPYHHRDARNGAAVARVHARIGPEALYARNGLQFLPFNTLYQAEAASHDPWFGSARAMLLMPDLLGHRLTGVAVAERTNASTTGLLDPRTREWDTDLLRLVGVDPAVLPPLRDAGSRLGTLLPDVARATGLPATTPVTLVGSHDTASAVVGVPAGAQPFAYVSSGTWSLVGVELPAPILDDAGRVAGFTNEGGIDGSVRYLHNVMGLWLLQESLRTWTEAGRDPSLPALLDAAAVLPEGGPQFDPNDPAFLPPGDMPARIRAACSAAGTPLAPSDAAVVRAILDSLAAAYAHTVKDVARLTGRSPEVVHLVGGGSRNGLLCRLTARSTGLPVLAGPVEATAIGNVLVQARALGRIRGGIEAMRARVRATQPIVRYEPQGVGT